MNMLNEPPPGKKKSTLCCTESLAALSFQCFMNFMMHAVNPARYLLGNDR